MFLLFTVLLKSLVLLFIEFLFSRDINTNTKFMFGMTTLDAVRQEIIKKQGVIDKVDQDHDSIFKVVNYVFLHLC